MAPVLIVMYTRLARREDAALAERFGEAARDYALRTPAFLPGRRARRAAAADRGGGARAPGRP
ncbi:MAG: isoprenylcysteine carboxyl methyltransferase [Candidatus Rokubacteria bacterium]|nr:isoprenylcysteine carboxyl methyltransferase [Candidatus Rokubacteria bacterium]MBI3108162.1 isoprenylcysteine carboxyl methyltransferase [Candidatus Rokubacteria bacterium]